ncbi:MAG: hypothetical protein ACRC33_14190 [Gemmataceae bacterium]
MRFTTRATAFCALALAALIATPPTSEASVGTGAEEFADWTPFSWEGGPGAVQNEAPFRFTVNGPVWLDVTDTFAPGDRFRLTDRWYEAAPFWNDYDFQTGQINVPGNYIPDPALAFGSNAFSHLSIQLGAGTHELTFSIIQIAEGAPDGVAYFRVTPDDVGLAQVPEPGTLVLAACGVAGMAFPGLRRWTRRREPQPA